MWRELDAAEKKVSMVFRTLQRGARPSGLADSGTRASTRTSFAHCTSTPRVPLPCVVQKYEDKAKHLKEEYESKYGKVERTPSKKAAKGKGGKDAGDKKPRALSAYMFFSQKERTKVIAENPELAGKVAEVAKELGKKWKSLTAEQKKPYEKMAADDKAAKA